MMIGKDMKRSCHGLIPGTVSGLREPVKYLSGKPGPVKFEAELLPTQLWCSFPVVLTDCGVQNGLSWIILVCTWRWHLRPSTHKSGCNICEVSSPQRKDEVVAFEFCFYKQLKIVLPIYLNSVHICILISWKQLSFTCVLLLTYINDWLIKSSHSWWLKNQGWQLKYHILCLLMFWHALLFYFSEHVEQ